LPFCSISVIFVVFLVGLKKILAISMLAVHLFNLGGYRLVFDNLATRSDDRMEARLDQHLYAEKDLIELKVPVNLPYHSNWTDFERYDGEINIAGVHYSYVKRKLQNDTLILLAIPNTDKMKLFNARETFFSLVNDMQQDRGESQMPAPAKPVKIFSFEYAPEQLNLAIQVPESGHISHVSAADDMLPVVFPNTSAQPPEVKA
jgi:hypothetical protein